MADERITPRPLREVRARHDDATLTVYQAYAPPIAEAALTAGRFVAPFRRGRMTWIKPSFLWMMYRCGWGHKPDQERILAISINRTAFANALAHSVLSHFDPELYESHEQWQAAKSASPIRVQWDPERNLNLSPLPWRSLQVGLSGSVVDGYVDEWIVGLTEVTALAQQIESLVERREFDAARALLPDEQPLSLPSEAARAIGSS